MFFVYYFYAGEMAWHVLYMYSFILGAQKSQSGNQVAVSTDYNYSRTLDY